MKKLIFAFLVAILVSSNAFASGMIIGSGGGAGPVTLFTDTFTEAGSTALESHTADTGEDWSGADTTTFTVGAGTGTLTCESADSYYAVVNETASSADYYVEVVGRTTGTTSSDRIGAIGRWADTTHFYYCYFDGVGTVKLFVNNAGWTQIGSNGSIPSFSASTDYTLRLSMDGTSMVCAIDGTTRASGTDSALSAAGKPGINMSLTTATMTSATAVTIP